MSKRPTDSRDWSSASESLFRSARGDNAPTEADRERVRSALAQRLTDASNTPMAGAGSDTPLRAVRQTGLALSTLVKVGLGVAVAVAGVFAVLFASDSPERDSSTSAALPSPRVAERVATPHAVDPPAAVPANEAPFARAANDESSADATRRAGDRPAVAKGSTRVRSGTKPSEARARERSSPREDTSALSQPADSTAREPSHSMAASAEPAAVQSTTSATRAPARPASISGVRVPARVDSSSTARTATDVEDDFEDRIASRRDDEDSVKRTASQTEHESHERAPVNPELDPSDPRAELFFVRRIQSALLDAEPRKVLSLCAEHERRWPRGTFVQEREGLRAIASCQSGTRDAVRRAKVFFAAYPRGPLAPRVRQACASPLKAAAVEARPPASGEVDSK